MKSIKRRMHLFPILLSLLFGVAAAPAHANCTGGDCVLVWEDNFNGSSVDTSKWAFQYGNGNWGWGNNEKQYYRAENAVVAGGNLTITAKDEDFGGQEYTSARLRTKNLGDWTYGRFEMRAKLPTGKGIWPAFWMLPTNSPYGGWPGGGEIDIMEIIGSDPDRIHGTIHYGLAPCCENIQSSGNTIVLNPPGTANNDFHVYAVEWEANEIRWYIDGALYSTKTSWWSSGGPYPAPFDVDFHLLLNLAVGGQWPGDPNGSTVFPQHYVIDYVRVYQAGPAGPNPVFDDMEQSVPSSWYTFNDGAVGSTGVQASGSVPPTNGGSVSLDVLASSGGSAGYFGGFGRNRPLEVSADHTEFRMWINPDAGQDYLLDINLQEDDDNNGTADEEFAYNCVISPTGPCAIAGGGWQLVTIPLASFVDDNSFLPGGNSTFDPVSSANGGNGILTDIVMTITSNTGADVSFRTDYWTFYADTDADDDGIDDSIDNCTYVANPDQVDSDGDLHGNACDGDFTVDCATNIFDLFAFKAAFGSSDPADAQFDLNSTGGPVQVNIFDLFAFKGLFGNTPGPSPLGSLCNQ